MKLNNFPFYRPTPNAILIATLLLFRLEANSQTPTPAALPDFDRITAQHAKQRADAITRINAATLKALDALKSQYMQRSNLESALKTQGKIDELKREIQELAQIATPQIGTKGSVYIDKHEGNAGLPEFQTNTTYQFDIAEITTRAIVTILAVPPKQSSNGTFILKNKKNTDVIGAWSQKSAESGRIEINASKWITKPGKYSIEVKWKGGEHGLRTTAISIDTRTQ